MSVCELVIKRLKRKGKNCWEVIYSKHTKAPADCLRLNLPWFNLRPVCFPDVVTSRR